MSEISTLISNVGFPIVSFLLMYRLYKSEKEQMRKEREKWVESIGEHTEVLKSLRRDIVGPTRDFYRGGSEEKKPVSKSKSD